MRDPGDRARDRARVLRRGGRLHADDARTSPGPPTTGKGTIVVGVSGAFTENQIVAEMYAPVLEHAGYTVERQFDLRSREFSQSALESGQIDLKPEYLSSLLFFLDANAEHSSDPEAAAARRIGRCSSRAGSRC